MSEPDVELLRAELEAAANPDDAEPMSAYMRHRFPFIGVKTPARRAASKQMIREVRNDLAATRDLVAALWSQPEREFHQVAVDAVAAVTKHLDDDDLPWLAELITTNSWWDTVDALSPSVGSLVLDRRHLWDTVDVWADSTGCIDQPDEPDMWLARVSIIHQLRYKERTNADVLYDRCLRRSADTDFFIRKAIGWALRTHARLEPDSVRTFVDEHRGELSTLSIREATKHL